MSRHDSGSTGAKPLTNKSGEVREMKGSDFKRMKPMSEVLPKDLQKVIRQR